MTDTWPFTEDRVWPEQVPWKESLFSIANGHLGTRGTFEEGYGDSVRPRSCTVSSSHHPGTCPTSPRYPTGPVSPSPSTGCDSVSTTAFRSGTSGSSTSEPVSLLGGFCGEGRAPVSSGLNSAVSSPWQARVWRLWR